MQKHPDADAFMRSYLEQPADTVARLVFADWLEETGKPHLAAWAHFIRARIQADHHPPDSPERRELDREADTHAPHIRARLTIPAQKFVSYPKSLLQLLPAPNITVRLAHTDIPVAVLELIPESVARENFVLPLDLQGQTLLVAMANPCCDDTTQRLQFILNKDIVAVHAEQEDIQDAIDRLYGQTEVESIDSILVEFVDPAIEWPLDDSAVGRVNLLIQEAISLRADRLLLYPNAHSVGVRFRIDGEWFEREQFPAPLLNPVTSRLALMAKIVPVDRVFEEPYRDSPFLGIVPIHVHGVAFRLRVSIQPSPDGPTTQIDFVREPVS